MAKNKREATEAIRETKYLNTLGGTLKIDDTVFPGGEAVYLSDEQANTKRMKHAIACGVVHVVRD